MAPLYRNGERVKILERDVPVHNRTPKYVRGRTGVVIQYCGVFGEPERLAYGDQHAPQRELYRVRLRQNELWPHYEGSPLDHLEIELFSHWLTKEE